MPRSAKYYVLKGVWSEKKYRVKGGKKFGRCLNYKTIVNLEDFRCILKTLLHPKTKTKKRCLDLKFDFNQSLVKRGS